MSRRMSSKFLISVILPLILPSLAMDLLVFRVDLNEEAGRLAAVPASWAWLHSGLSRVRMSAFCPPNI